VDGPILSRSETRGDSSKEKNKIEDGLLGVGSICNNVNIITIRRKNDLSNLRLLRKKGFQVVGSNGR